MLPSTIGRYEIIAELGRGAMGVVYRAKDPAIGRIVALKTLRLDNSAISHEELVKRFQQEARAAGALNHRNIVTIYDAGESDETFYIAMEYLDGQTLAELLRKQRSLHPDTVAEIGAQICAGLGYAHDHGVVHRDIKPANIMITDASLIKIMDFGIAKVEASLTMTGQVVGTPDYMSPEQVKGNRLDGRSDLFSLGVILYEMATGERPFVGQSVTTIMYKIVHEAPVPPERLDSSVPEGLGGIIMRALAKAPEARYQTAQHMADALHDYSSQPAFSDAATIGVTALNWQPPATQPPVSQTAAESSVGPHKSRRRHVWLGGLALLIAFGLTFLVRSGHNEPSTPASQGETANSLPQSGEPQASEPPKPAKPPAASGSHAAEDSSQMKVTVPGIANVEVPDIKNLPGAGDIGPDYGQKIAAKVLSGLGGQLIVDSEPKGAQVELDGKALDKPTPVTVPASPGAHEIVLTMPGFQPLRMTVPMTPGHALPIRATLTPQQGAPSQDKESGRLQLQTKPSRATVQIHGPVNLVGMTSPLEDVSLPPGKYRATILLDNFMPVSRDFEIKAGKTAKIKETLKAHP